MSNQTFATEKDHDRADGLNWRGNSFCHSGGDIATSNARKMAKLIKNRRKILGRLEAVAHRWGSPEIIRPFIDKVLELHPNSKYTSAYHSGINNGRYCMSPGRPYGGDVVQQIIYNFAFNQGRLGN